MPAVSTFPITGNPYVDGVLGDYRWATATLTFSFPASAGLYGGSYGAGEPGSNFAPFSATQQAVVRSALGSYASVAKLSFVETIETATNHADLRYAQSDRPGTAWAYLPSAAPEGGDAWFNRSGGYYSNPAKGNYAFTTFLHETGHALGLEHAHENYVMPTDRDSVEYTVMSYRSYVGASLTTGYTNENGGFPQSLMMYDIAAMQHMYGANYATRSGNTTYSWSATTGEAFIDGAGQGAPVANRVFETVWDGGGVDTYDFSNFSNALKVDLRPGEWTTTSSAQLARLHWDGSKLAVGNVANALLYQGDGRSLIENANGGSGADSVIGNQAANLLLGNGGADALYGLAGDDLLMGGTGADLLDGGPGSDIAFYSLSNIGVRADLSGTLAGRGEAAGDTFNLIDGLWGSQYGDELYGDQWSNQLYGYGGVDDIYGRAGNDSLFGQDGNDNLEGGLGADLLDGGAGFDFAYYSQAAAGVLVDLANSVAGTNEALGDVFTLMDGLVGSQFADILFGDQWSNTLNGANGGDYLDGGKLDDKLYGSTGADTFGFGKASGWDTVMDFEDNIDTINLRGWGFSSVAQALSYCFDTGSNVRFDFADGSHLTVTNVAVVSDLNDDVQIA